MRAAVLVGSFAIVACSGEIDPPDPECIPGGGGPHWLVEGETVTVALACTAEGEVRDEIAVADLPAGAAYDPARAELTWTPGLDQAAVYDLVLSVPGETATGTVRIGVADAFDTPGNEPPLDPARYAAELGLPVIFVSPAPSTEEYEPVTVVYGGRTYAAEAKLRGATSLDYPKNSYTVKFASGDHLDDPERGFRDKKRIVLTQAFDDNTYVRQRLGFELWNAMDEDHVEVQAFSAVVYLDGEFWGLYELTDHVDKNLFEAHGHSELGNVYKSYNHDANFGPLTYDGDPKQTLHDGYVKKDGTPAEGQPGAFDDLDALVRFVATAPDAQFADELPYRVDLRDVHDWYVFVTHALASDSGGKNAYLYHDPMGGPWRYAPWDLNHSYGQSWQTFRTAVDDFDDFRSRNNLFVRISDDPVLAAGLAARYAEMLNGPLATEAVLARYDAMVAETAAVARRDWRRWSEMYAAYWSSRDDLTDYDGEVAYVREWLRGREAFLRSYLAL